MKTIKHPIAFSPAYPLERIAPREDLLFFDIETTGFSGASSQLYLIGCVYFDGFGWRLIQWFADTRGCEAQLLDAFFSFMKDFRVLVHFNGDGFDIPYLLKCCSRLGLSHSFDGIESLDIYKKIKPLRSFLGLESMKQKAVEAFLGVSREDVYTGGELIDVYRRYLYTGDEGLLRLLLLHNEDDLKGMPAILPILHYPDALSSPFLLKESCLLPQEGGEPCHSAHPPGKGALPGKSGAGGKLPLLPHLPPPGRAEIFLSQLRGLLLPSPGGPGSAQERGGIRGPVRPEKGHSPHLLHPQLRPLSPPVLSPVEAGPERGLQRALKLHALQGGALL